MNGNNLKECREILNMTQKELGKVFNLSEFTISGWENSHDSIPLEKLVKFCNMYNFSIDYILKLDKEINSDIKINLDKKKVGENLKKLRKELKLTQANIAKICSISQTTYSNYEIGLNLISTTTLYIICKKNNISAYQILN